MRRLSELKLKDMYEEYEVLFSKFKLSEKKLSYEEFKSVYRWA